MWNAKEPKTDMEEILNDTITAQELEVSRFHNYFHIAPVWLILCVALCLQKFEKTYHKELSDKKCVSAKTQFEVRFCDAEVFFVADEV